MNTLTSLRYRRYVVILAATAGCVAACGPIHGGVVASPSTAPSPTALSFKNPLIFEGLTHFGIKSVDPPQPSDSPTVTEQAALDVAARQSASNGWGDPVEAVLASITTVSVNGRDTFTPEKTSLVWVIDVSLPGGWTNPLIPEHKQQYEAIVVDAKTGKLVMSVSGG